MRNLSVDIETYSAVSIADCGAYKYAMDPSFEILLVAYAVDDEPTRIFDLAQGEELPEWFGEALRDPKVTKHAHNAVFERICFTMYLRRHKFHGHGTFAYRVLLNTEWLDPAQWVCSSVLAARCGLPMSLKMAGAALHLEEQKMDEGKALIQLFCCPRRTKAGSDGFFGSLPERVQPSEFPEKWETFKRYCVRDVDVERSIERECSWYHVSEFEQQLYAIDQHINDRGVLVDLELARQAVRMDNLQTARLSAEAVTITQLSNPNSPSQLKAWLSDQLGLQVDSLTKAVLPDLQKAAQEQGKPLVGRVLRIRAEMGKTSNAKYGAMLDVAGSDGRARGLTQFYGSRTGRWAGRLIQMQNLPQNHIGALAEARAMLREGDYDSIDLTFGNVPDTMSQLIRTAFIAPKGRTLAVCDFSAIEARVLAWMAGEDWVLDVFRNGGDIYCATASQMFHVPVEKHGRNAELRQKGKVAVLALGYQGGMGALDKMGGSRLGMTEDEERETVTRWRKANPNIVALWGQVEKAAKECIVYKTARRIETKYMTLRFCMEECGTMTIELPSGRKICYPEAELHFEYDWAFTGRSEAQAASGKNYINKEKKSLHPERYYGEDGASIRFKGMNQTTKKWEWVETYGGKITENVTQAIARDCLANTMAACENAGYPVVFHIHDELVMEVDSPDDLAPIESIFSDTPEWGGGLPLRGAGYCTPYYLKD